MNMHYCRFENTYRALLQIEGDLLNNDDNLSETETRFRTKIRQIVLDWADEIREREEEEHWNEDEFYDE